MSLKIGVVGAYRGKSMIDVLMVYKEAELVAICDFFEPALKNVERQAKKLGLDNITYYTEFDEFLKHEGLDAVVLANYAHEHAPFAIKCLNAGKHVMSEVLPCETMAQAVELIEAVEKSGKVYAYAENYCYMNHTFEMWKTYEKGEIGEVKYAEGEYVHDCTSVWPQISYGDKTHWRNNMYPTFYCTHSLGPIITITGRRPVKVIGYEFPPNMFNYSVTGGAGGGGMEMVTLDNGAVVKSLHAGLKREPSDRGFNYQVYCEKGMMETGRFEENSSFNYYQEEKNRTCEGEWKKYEPVNDIQSELMKQFPTHGGGDFYSTYFFVQKILGKPDGKWSIDVYQAVDMGICGILAWRSALNGNQPVDVPNLRNPEERDAYRNDHACTTPATAGDQLLPRTSYPNIPKCPDEMYKKMERLWKEGKNANGDPDLIYSAILDVTDEENY